jgi:hypothetical protein
MLNRRQFSYALPVALAATEGVAGCTSGIDESAYQSAAQQTWRVDPLQGLQGAALGTELVRCATLAPSSHNTQCWKFALEKDTITILPDLSRRCPAVDPDDHHLYVSLGCAAENLIQAARAHGLRGEAKFDEARSAVRITLSPVAPEVTDLFNAIASRQSTRAEYDGKPIASGDLTRLETAAKSDRVRLLLLTDRPALENVLDFVVQGNTAQMNDKAFVDELQRRRRRAPGRWPVQQIFRQPGSSSLAGWLDVRLLLHAEGREPEVRQAPAEFGRCRGVRLREGG